MKKISAYRQGRTRVTGTTGHGVNGAGSSVGQEGMYIVWR
ncbi:hypothetical protein HMPREF3033_01001 [Veillonellaceae bacterium DNF00751]|uniref:Uncharacterized protein n=1 Tax=Megasphaera lornae TaxID=1000568 RepID=D3LTH0_9FIRM|nr:hypothetical protein HMPREF0889_0570 [Megasphaera genomosp. type_1 str. 28L]EGL40711.1 hypothetical protein HMPREF1039_1152 [Megasphaera lornae]KXB91638.1 hypothetical protein HMPREF3033_01001 [Veillonellaceae bacterium DNF00751]